MLDDSNASSKRRCEAGTSREPNGSCSFMPDATTIVLVCIAGFAGVLVLVLSVALCVVLLRRRS